MLPTETTQVQSITVHLSAHAQCPRHSEHLQAQGIDTAASWEGPTLHCSQQVPSQHCFSAVDLFSSCLFEYLMQTHKLWAHTHRLYTLSQPSPTLIFLHLSYAMNMILITINILTLPTLAVLQAVTALACVGVPFALAPRGPQIPGLYTCVLNHQARMLQFTHICHSMSVFYACDEHLCRSH